MADEMEAVLASSGAPPLAPAGHMGLVGSDAVAVAAGRGTSSADDLLLRELERTLYVDHVYGEDGGRVGATTGTRRYHQRADGEVPFVWEKSKGVVGNSVDRFKALFWIRLKAYLFSAALVFVLGGVYIQAGNYAGNKYIKWARADPARAGRLPDMILDEIKVPTEDSAYTWVGDGLALLAVPVSLLYLGIFDFVVLTCTWAQLFGLHWFFNMIAENVTVMPSSYTYERCLVRSSLKHGEDYKYNWNSMLGSCAAMIWSGHTFNTFMGSYFLTTGMRYQYPEFWGKRWICGDVRKANGCVRVVWTLLHKWAGTTQMLVITVTLAVEIAMLLLDYSHYSVDIYMALLIVFLTLTNDRFQYFAYYINPWAPCPMEDNLYYQKQRLRKAHFLLKKGCLRQAVEWGRANGVRAGILYNPWCKADREMVAGVYQEEIVDVQHASGYAISKPVQTVTESATAV